MSNKQKPKKKTVVVSKKARRGQSDKLRRTVSRAESRQKAKAEPLIFGRANYIIMLLGIGVIALGMILMLGGSMPSPDVWDDRLIYSFRRTVLAPIFIIAGFTIEIYAIFKKP